MYVSVYTKSYILEMVKFKWRTVPNYFIATSETIHDELQRGYSQQDGATALATVEAILEVYAGTNS